jgi:hypothetical protein
LWFLGNFSPVVLAYSIRALLFDAGLRSGFNFARLLAGPLDDFTGLQASSGENVGCFQFRVLDRVQHLQLDPTVPNLLPDFLQPSLGLPELGFDVVSMYVLRGLGPLEDVSKFGLRGLDRLLQCPEVLTRRLSIVGCSSSMFTPVQFPTPEKLRKRLTFSIVAALSASSHSRKMRNVGNISPGRTGSTAER